MMTVDYPLLARQLAALLDTRDWLTNSAQTAAFLMQEIPELNWAGFYLQREPETLCLGPFQGDRKSTRLNSSHVRISYAVFCLKKKIDLLSGGGGVWGIWRVRRVVLVQVASATGLGLG